jgi:CHAT domain-containing protein
MKTQEAYANRVVLAEYFTTDEGTMLFIGRSDLEQPQLYQFDVSREDLWWWQHTFEDLAGDEPSSWDVDAWQYQLGRLTEPISTWSNEGDLVWIVPHRELHRLPLHALKIGDRYLIERNPVCYAPSASMMQFCRTKRTGRRQNALVVGDSLNDLSYARAEAHTVANLFNTEPLLGNRATKSTIKDHLNENRSGLDILHFACHGEYDFRISLNSRIKLAPDDTGNGSDGGDENPDLTAEEILGLEMQADLVTLSACESGVSEHRPGDELIGLTRSLIYAGTPSVLASLWSVHDRSTNILMKRFYDSLLSGTSYRGRPNMSKAYALQTAQRHVLSLTDFEHPYYWAPFVLVGDWS